MKMIIKIVLLYTVILFFTGCEKNEDAFVYIRAVDPHTIEYVVAKDSNVETSKIGNIIRKEL